MKTIRVRESIKSKIKCILLNLILVFFFCDQIIIIQSCLAWLMRWKAVPLLLLHFNKKKNLLNPQSNLLLIGLVQEASTVSVSDYFDFKLVFFVIDFSLVLLSLRFVIFIPFALIFLTLNSVVNSLFIIFILS